MQGTPPRRKRTRALPTSPSSRRMAVAAVALAVSVAIGTGGYHWLGDGRWGWFDCLYMTVITLATVGYGETLPGLPETPGGREWTLLIILLGSGSLLYFISTVTAFVVEGDLGGVLGRRRMQHRIDALRDHVLVCGAGLHGRHVADELARTGTPFVIVDPDQARLLDLAAEHPHAAWVHGDPTDDDVLEAAGVQRAATVVTTLDDDRDNVFVCISVRALNDRARLVARAVQLESEAKLRRAGADAVVSPAYIGGLRLASEAIRPSVVQFLDRMLRDTERAVRVESVRVPIGSPLAGKPLRSSGIREHTRLLVVAIERSDRATLYNPPADTPLAVGDVLVVMGESADVARLKALAG